MAPYKSSKTGRFRSRKQYLQYEKNKEIVTAKPLRGLPSTPTAMDDTTKEETSKPVTGLRIIDINLLAEQLAEGCTVCKSPLELCTITSEYRTGLASLFYMKCTCGALNCVTTGTQHKVKNGQVFDINTKIAGGLINAGIATLQLNKLLTAIDIPPLCHKTIKRRQDELLPAIDQVATTSCNDALQQEKNLTYEASDQITFEEAMAILCESDDEDETASSSPNNSSNPVCVSYDMGWQKRGSGRSYNSMSGVGTLVGNHTQKIVAYGLRCKDCSICKQYKSKSENPPSHDCNTNWKGSSKAMEPDLASELVQEIEGKDCKLSHLIMDDDTTTEARLKRDLDHEFIKLSEYKHTCGAFQNALYTIKQTHKEMNKDVIKHFNKSFSYALSQNKDEPVKLKAALESIVPHAFGSHSGCGEWCGYKRNPVSYRHSILPGGRNLEGSALRSALTSVMQKFISKVNAIAPCGSTKANESFNYMVASKAPKRIHYSATNSLKARVSSSVAQKNLGHDYLSKVYEEIGLTSSKHYSSFATSLDKRRKAWNDKKCSKSYKKKRLDFYIEKTESQKSLEIHEGTTYKSKVALQDTESNDIDEIPAPVSHPNLKKYRIQEEILQDSTVVYFDLETTSFEKECEIIQIGAYISIEDNFNVFIKPSRKIPQEAEDVTGLHFDEETQTLYQNGHKVDSLEAKQGLEKFLVFLQNHKPTVLLAHNCTSFDSYRLVNQITKLDLLADLHTSAIGFIDSLPFFKKHHKDLPNHQLGTVASSVGQCQFGAHDALEDTKALSMSCRASSHFKELLTPEFSFKIDYTEKQIAQHRVKIENYPSLQCLVDKKVMSKVMCEKMARSGLRLGHLELAYKRNGKDGLISLLGERDEGNAIRVTKTKKIIDRVDAYMSCKEAE